MEGFRQTGFFLENTTPCGWRFFEKPKGLESVFLITWNYTFAFFFSVFCFYEMTLINQMMLYLEIGLMKMGGSLKGVDF